TQDGKLYGGSPLRRCHVYNLLGNIVYSGRIKVGEEIFPGEHDGIIDVATFDQAQARLKQNAWTPGNPRASGTCSVDPNNNITETNEGNNGCSDSVTVTAPD